MRCHSEWHCIEQAWFLCCAFAGSRLILLGTTQCHLQPHSFVQSIAKLELDTDELV